LCFFLKILYYLFFGIFITITVLFLAQFWVWGDITFKNLNNLVISDRGEAILIASAINQASFSFFISLVFPTALVYALIPFILNFLYNRISSAVNSIHNHFNSFNILEILRAIMLKYIVLYGMISWLLFPITYPQIVLAELTYIHIIWQALVPYYYIYFILLTLISILSYLRANEPYFENTLLEQVSYYKYIRHFFRPYK
jgi:hypothetical protein